MTKSHFLHSLFSPAILVTHPELEYIKVRGEVQQRVFEKQSSAVQFWGEGIPGFSLVLPAFSDQVSGIWCKEVTHSPAMYVRLACFTLI